MTTNAQLIVDQVLAGYTYKHYYAREIYYTGTQNGPHVVIYLSDEMPLLLGPNAIWCGAGVRVECYTSLTTNLGAQRLTVANFAGGNLNWGVQDLVLSDCRPTLMGGVLYDLPAAYNTRNVQANLASSASALSQVLLSVFVLIALFWSAFRRR